MKNKITTSKQLQTIKDMRIAGSTLMEIARHFKVAEGIDVSHYVIRDWVEKLKKAGHTIPDRVNSSDLVSTIT